MMVDNDFSFYDELFIHAFFFGYPSCIFMGFFVHLGKCIPLYLAIILAVLVLSWDLKD